MPQISNQIEQRSLKYTNLLQAIADTSVAVFLHDATQGYDFLDVVSNTPQRLNKQKNDLVGKPLREVDERISEPRGFYIKKALETGLTQSFDYTYEDSHLWRFKCSVGFLPGCNEVIVITQDAEAWQTQYWLNKISEEADIKHP